LRQKTLFDGNKKSAGGII